MKNWKTTLFGVLAVLPQILPMLFPNLLTTTQSTALSILFVAAGFGVAKDNNVTGGTVVNVPNDASAVKDATKTNTP